MRSAAAAAFLLAAAASAKSIRTTLNAGWAGTSLLSEAAEFMGSLTDESLFWQFVDRVADMGEINVADDSTAHAAALSAASPLLSPHLTTALRSSIATRMFSPRVEMLRSAEVSGSPAAWVRSPAGAVLLTPEAVAEDVGQLQAGCSFNSSDEPFARYHTDGQPPTPTACVYVLHAALGDVDFPRFHSTLLGFAKERRVAYGLVQRDAGGCGGDVALQGYGVTLHIKNMEYKTTNDKQHEAAEKKGAAAAGEDQPPVVMGIDFARLRSRRPELAGALELLQERLQAEAGHADNAEVDFEVWQMQLLGYQASYRILKAADPLSSLTDVAGNFPRHAGALSHVSGLGLRRVTKAIQMAATHDRSSPVKYPVAVGASAVWMNGVKQGNVADLSPFDVAELLRSEYDLQETLQRVLHRFSAQGNVSGLLGAVGGGSREPPRFRVDHKHVSFLNNLETDAAYRTWSSELFDFLKPGNWGQVRYVSRNIVSAVFLIDCGTRQGLAVAQFAVRSVLQKTAGARFGVLLVDPVAAAAAADAVAAGLSPAGADDHSAVHRAVACLFKHAGSESDDAEQRVRAWQFLGSLHGVLDRSGREQLKIEDVRSVWKSVSAQFGASEPFEDLISGEQCAADLRSASHAAAAASVFFPPVSLLLNGLLLRNRRPDQLFYEAFWDECARLRLWIALRELPRAEEDVHEWVVAKTSAHSRFRASVFDSAVYEPGLSSAATHSVLPSVTWMGDPDGVLSHVLVVDSSTAEGRRDMLHIASFAAADPRAVRVGIVPRVSGDATEVVLAAALTALLSLPVRARAEAFADFARALDGARKAAGPSESPTGLLRDLRRLLPEGTTFPLQAAAMGMGSLAAPVLSKWQAWVGSLRSARTGGSVLYSNGRVLKWKPEEAFVAEDYSLLSGVEMARAEAVAAATAAPSNRLPDATFIVSAVLSDSPSERSGAPPHAADVCGRICRTGFTVGAGGGGLSVVAVLDPLSREAQVAAPLLAALRAAAPDSRITVWLNPKSELTEAPLKEFHRYVASFAPRFDEEGALVPPSAVFARLPQQQTLTMGLQEPEHWITTPLHAAEDLDNIRLAEIPQTLNAVYQLAAITVTGSCEDLSQGQPPRGLPLELRRTAAERADVDAVVDTLVMSNYGYFQLQAAPGLWDLRIQPGGRAADIYTLTDASPTNVGTFSRTPTDSIAVAVDSFSGHHTYLKVTRLPGQDHAQLLSDGSVGEGGAGPAPAKGAGVTKSPTLNIFSVASGHLYERFLKIMAHTVMEHADGEGSRVKFWVVNNFLSPHFKATFPHFARKRGFEFELVTYKWPHWLRRQTVKQRIIWGYKVLFLDVLFPLSVEKIIYVDADQIVRADLHELYNLPLHGHAVAYTPFCRKAESQNNATTGFRFWDQGFWKSHLRQIKAEYHISAIYVVDLRVFRRIAAGDRYRSTYDMLSEDPNSLANLDQDLPNYLQKEVAIYSLPEHWLWCETWCSDAVKAEAKTIDLCNNPLTKTPKLDAAKRIVPEWVRYDEEVADMDREAMSGRG